MKRIAAIIRSEMLHDVQQQLADVGFSGFTMSDVRGHGEEEAPRGSWRGDPYVLRVLHKIKIEILCEDDEVDQVAETIVAAARTGDVGDGIVYVEPVDQVWSIRTGRTNSEDG